MDDFGKLERARTGDRKAWSYLYVKYYDLILQEAESAVAKAGPDAEPEDLLQKYWIQSIQATPVAGKAAADAFDAWLGEDFRRWWKHQAEAGEARSLHPGTGWAAHSA